MPLSDRELHNVIAFYMGLRKVVFAAGIALVAAGVVAVLVGAFQIGRRDGLQAGEAATAARQETQRDAQAGAKEPTTEEQQQAEAPEGQDAARDDPEQDAKTDSREEAAPESRSGRAQAVSPSVVTGAQPAAAPTAGDRSFVAPPSDRTLNSDGVTVPPKQGLPRRVVGKVWSGLRSIGRHLR